ncbi:MAG: hypothetical protein PVF27_10310 [Gemmatimonadales bacterium]|jgi:hypothetical protein
MALYLTKRSIPELAVLSAAERDTVWSAARWRLLRRWQWWLALGVFGVAAYGFLIVLRGLPDGGASGAARVLLAGAFGGAGGLALVQIGIRLMRPHIRAMLAARQHPSEILRRRERDESW